MISKEASWAYGRDPIVWPASTKEGPNKFFHLNLPPDYDELSIVGQRKARINGIRTHNTGAHFTRAWNLFRTYYLRQLPEGVFYHRYIESPPMHYQAVGDLAAYQLNAWAFPRGAGKSTVLGKELPLMLLLAKQHMDIMMVLAKADMVTKRFSLFMQMFEDNQFITDDFGGVRPPRGSRVWNHHFLELDNGSKILGLPVEGKMLGERPGLVLCDDPEHDKAMVANPNPTALRDAFERLLFGTIMPMLREGSVLGWIGTLLDARSFLYEIMHSKDPRYAFWNRRNYSAFKADGSSVWKERWSPKELERLRQQWGEDYFQTHMMNKPGVGEQNILTIDDKWCQYKVEDEDEALQMRPLDSDAALVVSRPVPDSSHRPGNFDEDIIKRPYGDTVRDMWRIMTVDFAFTTGKRSDYSCCHILGFENSKYFRDTLYSLDMWCGKKTSAEFIQIILAMARKWQVRLIAAEAVSIQSQLVDQIATEVEDMEKETGWIPRVVPIRYPSNMPKAQRIAGLEWRFKKFRVKLPEHKRATWPYKELYEQTSNFTLDLSRLRHDDALETLCMYQFVGRPRGHGARLDAGEKRLTATERLRDGETHDEYGIPLISSLMTDEIPVAELRNLEKDTEEDVIWRPA